MQNQKNVGMTLKPLRGKTLKNLNSIHKIMIINHNLVKCILLINFLVLQSMSYAQEISYTHKYKNSPAIDKIAKLDGQFGAFFYATIGEYKKSSITWDKAVGKSFFDIDSLGTITLKKDYLGYDAIPFIINKAKNTDYVILNEEHHRPQHRIFAKQLLKDLYDNGYRNLAVETLSTHEKYIDTLLNTRRYPLVTSGSYSREPQFGAFIREALQLGFYIFPYDNMSLSGKERERQGAQNIVNTQKKGKTFVYCGFQHALEGEIKHWEKALAENIKLLTGSDPLTIDQTVFNESNDSKLEHPLYNSYTVSEPKILADKNEIPYQHKENGGYYDLSVIHPRTTYKNNRPSWVFHDGKKPIEIEINTVTISKPYLLFAFRKEEDYNTAVPIDIIEIDHATASPVCLALEKGNYTLIFANGNGRGYKMEKKVK